jgi:hypothetical protein
MNLKQKITAAASVILALVLGIGIGSYASSGYGSSSDPLITLSYLTDKLTPELMAQVDKRLSAHETDLEQRFTDLLSAQSSVKSENYTPVTLSSGQTLTGAVGCEILLRTGGAAATAALADTSSGSSVGSGTAITANHLYLVTSAGTGVKASASSQLLVRGEFTVK